jgi:Translation initiation factor 2 (IF-2; GTPase)
LLVSGDVHGSVEAILDVLETYDGDATCKLNLVHYGVGNVSETDVELADAFKGQYKSLLQIKIIQAHMYGC